jgi:FAD/FMN-containing dehydrogenase
MSISAAPSSGFTGDLITPDDARFDDARAFFNKRYDRRPALIARCQNADDVVSALSLARERGLEVAVRSGGHSVPGYSAIEGGMLIDLGAMRGIEVDTDARRAWVQPGLTGGGVTAALAPHGLTVPAGGEYQPGFVSLAIHGGFGLLGRRLGWASDSIRGARLVTASGEQVRVSADENADLLYGIRGAGSNFGIVTELEIDVHAIPAKVAYGGFIFSGDDLATVVPGVVSLLEGDASDNLALVMAFWVEGDQTCVHVGYLHSDDPENAAREIAQLEALGTAIHHDSLHASYAEILAASGDRAEERFCADDQGLGLTGSALADALLQEASQLPPAPQPGMPSHSLIFAPFGGAFMREQELPTPVPRRSSPSMWIFAAWNDPSADAAMGDWVASTSERVRGEIGNGLKILNFDSVTGPDTVRAAYGDEAYHRLQSLKRTYDPENLFHLNHNVGPSEA